jgi:hypothetical protein
MIGRENAMKKELEANDNAKGNQQRPPQQQSGDKRNQRNEGKALQVNDNSAGGKEPGRSQSLPRRGSGDKPNAQKLQGKALQVNENSVEKQTQPR